MTFSIARISPTPAWSCGPDTDCRIGARTYRIRMPEGHDGTTRVGAIFFMHGYRGTAAGIMRNKSLARQISKLGIALVAPKSARADWDIPNAPSSVGSGSRGTELAFFDKLIDDVVKRFPIDPAQLMASGFSAGGMMVWNLACERSNRFAGFAPISGTFWAPVPKSCTTPPPHLIHTHGTTDRVVPLRGRSIGSARQGSVYAAMDMMGRYGDYRKFGSTTDGKLKCQRKINPTGKILELCLHPGGHSMRTAYVIRAWNQFKQSGAFGK